MAQLQTPEFIYSPYPDFRSTLRQGAVNLALGAVDQISTNVTNEARFARNGDVLRLDRPHPEWPPSGLLTRRGCRAVRCFTTTGIPGATTKCWTTWWWRPGGTCISSAAVLWRQSQGPFTFRGDGFYFVESVQKLASSEPLALLLSYDRTNPAAAPEYDRRYRSSQGYFFLQDSFRLRPEPDTELRAAV